LSVARLAEPALRVDRRRHQEQPVGVRGPEHRAVVAVAHGERIGERVVQRQVGAFQVPHRERPHVAVHHAMHAHERIHRAAVEAAVLRSPAVVEIVQALRARAPCVEMERQHVTIGMLAVGLREYRLAVGKTHRRRIGKPAHPGQRAEVVIEGAVLLRQHDDVIDVGELRGAGRAGRQRQGGRGRQRDGALQETAAFEVGSGHAGAQHAGRPLQGQGPGSSTKAPKRERGPQAASTLHRRHARALAHARVRQS